MVKDREPQLERLLDAIRRGEPTIANADESPTKIRNIEPTNKYLFKAKPVKMLSAKEKLRNVQRRGNKERP